MHNVFLKFYNHCNEIIDFATLGKLITDNHQYRKAKNKQTWDFNIIVHFNVYINQLLIKKEQNTRNLVDKRFPIYLFILPLYTNVALVTKRANVSKFILLVPLNFCNFCFVNDSLHVLTWLTLADFKKLSRIKSGWSL